MTPLLCAKYRVRVVDRRTGLDSVHCDLDRLLTAVTWGRVFRNTSTVSLIIAVETDDDGRACCECGIRRWRDEIHVERLSPDGVSEGTVWSGPVFGTRFEPAAGGLIVTGLDRSVWFARRPESVVSVPVGTDEAEAWWLVVRESLGMGDGTEGISVTGLDPTGEYSATPITAGSDTMLGTDLNDLVFGASLNSVAWTVVHNRLYGPGPTTTGDEPFGSLDTGLHWSGTPIVATEGDSTVSQVRLQGTDSDGESIVEVYPPEPVVDDINGKHIASLPIGGTWTRDALRAEARARWERNRDGQVYLITSAESLTSDAPVTVADLIPGRRFLVTATGTCEVLEDELLQVLNVVVDAERDEDGCLVEKRVAVDFTRAGSNASPLDQLVSV